MIKVNRQHFFKEVRDTVFGGSMNQAQVVGVETIITEFETRKLTDLRWLAYMLATAFHETAHTMQAIEEYGKGKGYDYGKKFKMTRTAYKTPDKLYYGRGFVQLTWYENYAAMGKLLNIDLLNKPELALDCTVAVKIMFEGMIRGSFTGASLTKFFNKTTEDWINARKIINGVDCASKIAEYGKKFNKALVALI